MTLNLRSYILAHIICTLAHLRVNLFENAFWYLMSHNFNLLTWLYTDLETIPEDLSDSKEVNEDVYVQLINYSICAKMSLSNSLIYQSWPALLNLDTGTKNEKPKMNTFWMNIKSNNNNRSINSSWKTMITTHYHTSDSIKFSALDKSENWNWINQKSIKSNQMEWYQLYGINSLDSHSINKQMYFPWQIFVWKKSIAFDWWINSRNKKPQIKCWTLIIFVWPFSKAETIWNNDSSNCCTIECRQYSILYSRSVYFSVFL